MPADGSTTKFIPGGICEVQKANKLSAFAHGSTTLLWGIDSSWFMPAEGLWLIFGASTHCEIIGIIIICVIHILAYDTVDYGNKKGFF